MERKSNLFTRILIVIFSLCLASMVAYNFFGVEPAGTLRNSSIFLILLILILILVEAFDSFSIGKILSISRTLNQKTQEVEKLENKNNLLLNQIISLANIQNQKQTSTNVFGDYYIEKPTSQKKIDNEKNVEELLNRIGDSLVISELEKTIIRELKEKNLDYTTETEKVLIRHLAGTQLLLGFEKIHKFIFGSQLVLLRKLAQIAPEGFTPHEIAEYFDSVKIQNQNSFNDWDENKYLSYLYSNILLTKGEGGKVHLTNLGEEYLNWIDVNNISVNKVL